MKIRIEAGVGKVVEVAGMVGSCVVGITGELQAVTRQHIRPTSSNWNLNIRILPGRFPVSRGGLLAVIVFTIASHISPKSFRPDPL